MKLSIEHTFAMTPAEYANLYFDEPFSTALCAYVRLGRALLRLDRTAERIVRHVRCEPIRDVPAPIAKLGGGVRFHYLEEIDLDLATLRGRWRVVPNLFTDRVDASGTIDFEPVVTGVKRVIGGEVNVAVFGLGGLIERFVVGEVLKGYADASSFTRSFLEQRLKSP
jgi:hypothetical protein